MLGQWKKIAAGFAVACGLPVQVLASPSGLPADFSVAPLSGQTRVNGVAIQIMTVSSATTPERACARVAMSWRSTARAAVHSCRRVGPWLLIDRREGSREQVVQFRADAGGAAGFYSELDLVAQPASLPGPRLPVPAGAQLDGVVQSTLSGSEMRQFTFRYALPPQELARRLWRRASARGWTSDTARAASGPLFDLERAGVKVRAVLEREPGGCSLVLMEVGALALPP